MAIREQRPSGSSDRQAATPTTPSAPRQAPPSGGGGGGGTEGRRTQAQNQVVAPSLSLPKGGGAFRGIGEKFGVGGSTGAASMRVPLPTSTSRGGVDPTLELEYSSGNGNGPAGLGWSLWVPSITRKTDKGIPTYGDDDVFVLGGAEDLVPSLTVAGAVDEYRRTDGGTTFDVRRYRPRVEGSFTRIERWQHATTGDVHWRVTTASNVVSVFGETSESRIADGAEPSRVFSWLLARTWNDRGELIRYRYKAEDRAGVADLAHERNRQVGAQRYLKRIVYGFAIPYDPAAPALPLDGHFELVLDYGDHDQDDPSSAESRPWAVRPDPFSSYRSGFEVRSYRLCRRALLFHRFPELGPGPTLVRSVQLAYAADRAGRADEGEIASFLTSVTIAGHVGRGAGRITRALPPLEFEYTPAALDTRVRTVAPAEVEHLPEGLRSSRCQWVDLDGEGLPGALLTEGEGWHYARSDPRYGDDDDPPSPGFAPVERVPSLPGGAKLAPTRRLADISGEGRLAVVTLDRANAGAYERSDDGGWQAFRPFRSNPTLDWSDPAVRPSDVDGDGLTDLLELQEAAVRWWPSLGRDGYGAEIRVAHERSRDESPRVPRGNAREMVSLADMTGDGLGDVVRVGNGHVTYWPNLGRGRFGPPVTMSDAPVFDRDDRFDPRRVRLGDVDGLGPTDLLYLHPRGPRLWRNRSGNGFAPALAIDAFPEVDDHREVGLFDLMGTGTACLVWSSSRAGEAGAPLRYVDLTGGRKPHLLERITNNMGAETRVKHASSTKFYLADRAAGRPWLTRLPFPTQVVERVESFDHVARTKVVTTYEYHHGCYDGAEREFRGFGRVEQRDTQTLARYSGAGLFTSTPDVAGDEFHLPPVRTVTWYHPGVLLGGDRVARGFEDEYWAGDPQAVLLEDTTLPPGLDADERREAARALKGQVLRIEVYAEDGDAWAANPFTVSEQRAELVTIQRRGPNRHAVFHPYRIETISSSYERDPTDPRVQQSLTLDIDGFGNAIETASIDYPRRARPDRLPEQSMPMVTATVRRVANRADQPDWYRIGVVAETRTWELVGIPLPAGGRPFVVDDLRGRVHALADIEPDADGTGLTGRRLLAHERTYYRSDDLTARLPLGTVESRSLPYESLGLAFTGGMVTRLYGGRATAALLNAAGYVHDGDADWWVPSSRLHYSTDPAHTAAQELAQARAHFYLPRRFRDPFGHDTLLSYDPNDLLPVERIDAVGNRSSARLNYRTLAPDLLTDANGQRTAVRFDALGMVAATFVLGAAGSADGDVFDDASREAAAGDDPSTVVTYDLDAWHARRQPLHTRTRVRERYRDAASPWQETWSYADGFGREILRKVQAEAGLAPLREPDGTLRRDGSGHVVTGFVAERWIGNGRVVHDNKGNPVKQYQPFFDSTPAFVDEADLVETGYTALLRYDALSRLIRTDLPDGTFRLRRFTPWSQADHDENDTVLGSRWYTERGAPDPAGPQPADRPGRAAWLAARHASTPTVALLDVQGRTVRSIADNGDDPGGGPRRLYETRHVLDAEGSLEAVIDATGRTVAQYRYDMQGRRVRHLALDGDDSLELEDIGGQDLRVWTRTGYETEVEVDALRRVVRVWVTPPAGARRLVERTVYGESHPDAGRRLRGRVFRRYDESGVVESRRFDFKGNLVEGRRRYAREHRVLPDWAPIAVVVDEAVLDTATASLLENESWLRLVRFDALNRTVQTVAPYRAGQPTTIVQPFYNRANLLEGISTWIRRPGAPPAGVLDRATADRQIVTGVDYDARGRRLQVTHGNGVETIYRYDPMSLRLVEVVTARDPGRFPAGERVVQALRYVYDAAGNVVETVDGADDAVFFRNRRVTAGSRYEYDPTYQLVSAVGREHLGLSAGSPMPPRPPGHDDVFWHVPHPHDVTALGDYVETYTYDPVGNLRQVSHAGAPRAGWTRSYAYGDPSAIEPARPANRLTSTSRPGDPAGGPYSDRYTYDAHGNLVTAPHLSRLAWDHSDRLRSTARQVTGPGLVPETTWYVYGLEDERVRKVTDRSAAVGATPRRKSQRLYFGDFEVYREYAGDGITVVLERESLHVLDGDARVTLVETATVDAADPASVGVPLLRFQHDDLVGSSVVELDGIGRLVTHEEFFPFGATAYLIENTTLRATAKRYRFNGKERDDESGLAYYGARYYASWLGRWTSCDPEGIGDHVNAYVFVRNNPVGNVDPNGRWTWRQVAIVAAVVTVAVVVTVATAGAGAVAVSAAATALGGTALGAGGAAAVTAVGTVAVGAAAGYTSSVAADVTAQAITRQPGQGIDWNRANAAGAGGAAAGGLLSVIPGASAARAVGTAVRTGRSAAQAAAAARSATAATGSISRQLLVGGGRGVVAGGAGGAVAEGTRQRASGEAAARGGYDWNAIGGAGVTGAAFGAGGAAAGTGLRAGVRNVRVRLEARRAAGSHRGSPAAAAAHEPASNQTFRGTNQATNEPLHPLLQARLREFNELPTTTHPNYYQRGDRVHAELTAVSRALTGRERALGLAPGSATADDLSAVLLHVRRGGDTTFAAPMERCSRCNFLTQGVDRTTQLSGQERRQINDLMSGRRDINLPF